MSEPQERLLRLAEQVLAEARERRGEISELRGEISELRELLGLLRPAVGRPDFAHGPRLAAFAAVYERRGGRSDVCVTLWPYHGRWSSVRGVDLRLSGTDEDGSAIGPIEARTGDSGGATFRDLPRGAYRLDLAGQAERAAPATRMTEEVAAVAGTPESPVAEPAAGTAGLAVAASTAPPPAVKRPPQRRRLFHHADRRVLALLEAVGSCSVLTIQTFAPELAGRRVRYRLGPAVGEVTLASRGHASVWSGERVEVQMAYEQACKEGPELELLPADPGEDGTQRRG